LVFAITLRDRIGLLSKKFKKKIENLCGLTNLDWEARQKRAEQILCNSSWKQQLCNDLQGLSFRDLELFLQGVVTERQKKEEGCERKLAANKGDNEKPLRRDSNRTRGSLKVRPASLIQAVPRTLAEILEQVHRPRESESSPSWREEMGALGRLGKERDPSVLPDNNSEDYRIEG
jgi:hypothetical protein